MNELEVLVETGFLILPIEKLTSVPAVKFVVWNPFDTFICVPVIEHEIVVWNPEILEQEAAAVDVFGIVTSVGISTVIYPFCNIAC